MLLGTGGSGAGGASGGRTGLCSRYRITLSQQSLLFAHLLGGTSDSALLHVSVFSDFGVHIMALEDDCQRESDDEKGDGSYGNQKYQ